MAKKVISEKLLTYETSIYEMIDGYAKNNKLSFETVLELFNEQTSKAINKDIDAEADIIFIPNHETKRVSIFNKNVEVVANDFEFEDKDEEKHTDVQRITFITIDDAKQQTGEDHQEGDVISAWLDFEILGEKTKTAIRHGFIQSLKLLEKQRIFDLYSQKIGEKLKAQVLSKTRKGAYNLKFEDSVSAFLPASKANEKLDLSPGKFIDVYLESVNIDSKLSICEVSLDSPKEVEDALKTEIPEIANQDVLIHKIQRIPGLKTKVAVKPNPERSIDFDIVGSIFGEGAKRILAVANKLNGEKIDIIRYSDDILEYIKNSLSPARVIDVVANNKKYYAIVKDEDVMTAIGKKGINIELAAKLTGEKIEVLTAEQAKAKGIQFNERQDLERLLVRSKANKHSKTNTYFKSIDIDLTDFKEDLAKIMNQEAEIAEVEKLEKQKTQKRVAPKTINATEIDNLFDKENLLIELEDENDYDFVEEINDIFDEDFSLEEQESKADDANAKDEDKSKKIAKGYQKSKIELTDFKVDSDLANYGLDTNIDLGEFEDDWED
ncbi:NusA N-terminal domain-containing protein [Mycoplasmopsis glycophila]|uniref:N utilization substance protein A n=1 Tax=Mycoplasmopsis glycophila TaxID=171285 RepID=A0A449AVM0_9BACT|nr:NusA N-terminal domain-containing protein [Mycoplasmopsis glycophila]VEU70590.1 N utilization substance protein A [Mycoplasmopsis glycophila]